MFLPILLPLVYGSIKVLKVSNSINVVFEETKDNIIIIIKQINSEIIY